MSKIVLVMACFLCCHLGGLSGQGRSKMLDFRALLLGVGVGDPGVGVVIIEFSNTGRDEVEVPLLAFYGKGARTAGRALYRSEGHRYYAGFELARVQYRFIDVKGTIVSEGMLSALPGSVELLPSQRSTVYGVIKLPKLKGKYRFTLTLDNLHLEKVYATNNDGPSGKEMFCVKDWNTEIDF